MRVVPANVAAAVRDAPGRGTQLLREQIEQSRLARAVRTQDAVDATRLQRQRYRAEVETRERIAARGRSLFAELAYSGSLAMSD